MNQVVFDRMVRDAKNEVGELVFARLGGTAADAVRAAIEVERIICEKVGPLNELIESAFAARAARAARAAWAAARAAREVKA